MVGMILSTTTIANLDEMQVYMATMEFHLVSIGGL